MVIVGRRLVACVAAGAALLLATVTLAAPQSPREDRAGTAAILQLGASARALGMAGAVLAVPEASEAVFYNSAALAGSRQWMVQSMYSSLLGQASFGAASVAFRSWGAGFALLTAEAPATDDLGYPTGGTAGYTQLAVSGAFGVPLEKGWALGLTARLFHERAPDMTGIGLTGDVMLRWQESVKPDPRRPERLALSAAGGVRDAWGSVQYTYRDRPGYHPSDPFDARMVAGVAARAPFDILLPPAAGHPRSPSLPTVLAALDADLAYLGGPSGIRTTGPRDLRIGVEVDWGRFALRGGVARALTGPDPNHRFSFGFSVALAPLRLDYALTLTPAVPESHRLSLAWWPER